MSQTTARFPDSGSCSDTLLYHVCYEAGTRLGGSLVEAKRRARARGDRACATAYLQQWVAMDERRRTIGVRDPGAQERAIEDWTAHKLRVDQSLDR